MARTLHPAVTSFFEATGSTLEETCLRAFPASHVPERLTTAEQLVEREALNQRDRRPASPLASYEITEQGSARHKQFGVNFYFADGTVQRFAPHTN
jgi:hypothetical protein